MNRLLVIDHDPHSALLTRQMLALRLPEAQIEAQSHHLDDLVSDFDMYWVNDNVDSVLSVEKLVFRIHRRQPQSLVVVWVNETDNDLATRLRLYGCDFIALKGEGRDLEEVLNRLSEHCLASSHAAAAV